MYKYYDQDLEVLIGKVFSKVEETDDGEIQFTVDENEVYILYHEQDCCEQVNIEDICGELNDLTNSPILMAEVSHNYGEKDGYYHQTWSFYKFATIKGYVTIRFYGESNGYYSETASLYRIV